MAQPKLHSAVRDAATPRHALFRLKAIASELRAKEATDPAQRQDWEELAIEWHLMANLADPGEQPAPHEPQQIGYYIENLNGAIRHVRHRR